MMDSAEVLMVTKGWQVTQAELEGLSQSNPLIKGVARIRQ